AVYFNATGTTANYEVRLYENQSKFDVIYGAMGQGGSSATVGVQGPSTPQQLVTQYECDAGGLSAGLQLTFVQPLCGTPTVTSTRGSVTPSFTSTMTPSPSPTACAVRIYMSTDVPKTICDLCFITSTLTVAGAGVINDLD